MRAKSLSPCVLARLLTAGTLSVALLSSCGSTETTPSGQADAAQNGDTGSVDGAADDATTADGSTDKLPSPVLDLVVDANRDGVADLANADDQAHGGEWTAEFGAAFLPNLDDDDGDKLEDVLDLTINGADDEKDLAPIALAPWKDAPDGFVGVLQLDHPEKVRLWKKTPEGWAFVAGIDNECVPKFLSCTGLDDDCQDSTQKAGLLTAQELRDGVQLGLEGRDFRRSAVKGEWDGTVHVSFWVGQGTDEKVAPIVTTAHPDGKEVVQLRVAPWILNGNLTPFDDVRSADYFGEFTGDLKIALGAANAAVKYTLYGYGSSGKKWNDAWTQDFYQTGFVSVPRGVGPDGKAIIHGMRVVNARPWGRYSGKCDPKLLPITYLRANHLGKDRIALAFYLLPNSGSSYDSHGNHDLLPAYENGQDKFPIGRIIHGSGILDETLALYNSQGPQSPSLEVDTSWLVVGHVDEVLSYVPAKTARGWKLLVADNNMAKQMLEKMVKDGYGQAKLFEGKQVYASGTGNDMVDAAISVTETLGKADLMQSSQEAQAATDSVRKMVVDAVGLTESELVPMPFLTEELDGGKVAWQPGTANLLVVGDHLGVPNPFGPKMAGVDVFAKDLQDRLGTAINQLGKDGNGLKVHLVDDFEGYHINLGEVHCGTNPEGPPQPTWQWWLVKH